MNNKIDFYSNSNFRKNLNSKKESHFRHNE